MPQELSKATLLTLTRAIKDEFCARGEPAALNAGFQQERFYRQSRPRWKELTRTARVVVVFSDFRESSGPGASPLTGSQATWTSETIRNQARRRPRCSDKTRAPRRRAA